MPVSSKPVNAVDVRLPSFPPEILELIFEQCGKRSLQDVSKTSKQFRYLVRRWIFGNIVIKSLEDLERLEYRSSEILESIRVLELRFLRREALESNPWTGPPSSHLVNALPLLPRLMGLTLLDVPPLNDPDVLIEPKGYPYTSLTPSLLSAIQSHPNLVTLTHLFQGLSSSDLDSLPPLPRPSSQPSITLPALFLTTEEGKDDLKPSSLLNFINAQGFQVDSLLLSVEDVAPALSLLDITVPSLHSIILGFRTPGRQVPPPPFDVPHFFPRLLARNPSLRLLSVRNQEVDDDRSEALWRTIVEVPGLEGLGDEFLSWIWAEPEDSFTDVRTFRVLLSEEEEGGRRSALRLHVETSEGFVVQRSRGHGELDFPAFISMHELLPDLEYLDLRDATREPEEEPISLLPPSLLHNPSTPSQSPSNSDHALSVIILPTVTHHLSPDLSHVHLPSQCRHHHHLHPRTSPPLHHVFLQEVLDDFDDAGGPSELWRTSTLPRLTAQVHTLAIAVPTLRIVQQRVKVESQSFDLGEQVFVWEVKRTRSSEDDDAVVEVRLRDWNETGFPLDPGYQCVCDLEAYMGEAPPKSLTVDEWWRDRLQHRPALFELKPDFVPAFTLDQFFPPTSEEDS